ncbi:hypothetical protein K525DRAFT_158484, partial [Schizophyllum commune Loenen D]
DVVIQVMVVAHSAIDAILNFHSTVVMNAITFRAAYSFFPVNTFVSMSGVCFEDDTFNGASAKYRRRGYDLRGSVEERAFPGLGDEVLCQERYVGDKYTWVVNFDTESDPYPDPFLFHSWMMVWSKLPYVLVRPKMIRFFFVSSTTTTVTRIFSTKKMLEDFTDRVTAIDPDKAAQTETEFLQAVIRTGADTLFAAMPPSAADTNFIKFANKKPVSSIGVHQLALSSVGVVSLMQCAFEEKLPNDASDDDDIV